MDHFNVGDVLYLLVAYMCEGEFCAFQLSTTAGSSSAANFTVYSMSVDGVLSPYQSLKIERSTGVKTFVLPDVGEQGDWVDTQFMVVSFRGSPALGDGGVGVWYWRNGRFEQRQVLPAVEAQAVDYISYKGLNLIAYTDNGVSSRVKVYNWVEGSFRKVSAIALARMVWVDGQFSEPIDEISVSFALDCKLYNSSHSSLYLAVLDRINAVTSGAQIKVYNLNQDTCQNQAAPCFEHKITMSCFGARSVTPLQFESYDLLAVAVHFEGMYEYQESDQYECNSYIYRMDYSSNSYSLLQTIRSRGAFRFSHFSMVTSGHLAHFLALSNARGIDGVQTTSRLFRWTDRKSSGSLSSPSFEAVNDISTIGCSKLQLVSSGATKYLAALSMSGTTSSLQVYRLEDNSLFSPRPVLVYPQVVGACDVPVFDARGSMNSLGNQFQVRWELLDAQMVEVQMMPELVRIESFLAQSTSLLLDFSSLYSPCQTQCAQDFPSGTYNLSLTLQNTKGLTSSTIFSFVKRKNTQGSFGIYGSAVRAVSRSQPVVIEAFYEASKCAATDAIFQSIWQISPKIAVAVANNSLTLTIPPYTLEFDQTYVVSLAIVTASQAATVQILLQVSIRESPVAILQGGDRLIAVRSEASYILDAASSYSRFRSPGDLHILWHCARKIRIQGAVIGFQSVHCDVIADASADMKYLSINSTALLVDMMAFSDRSAPTFTQGCVANRQPGAFRCDPTAIYSFRVVVCDKNSSCSLDMQGQAAKETLISTTMLSIPNVKIKPFNQSSSNNDGNTVILSSVDRATSLLWVQAVSIDNFVLKPENLASSLLTTTLILKNTALAPSTRYTFRLYASLSQVGRDSTGAVQCPACGWSQVDLLLRPVPRSGELVVSPTQGMAFSTKFDVTSMGWATDSTDVEDYPLLFSYGYLQNGSVQYLYSSSQKTSVNTVLPMGSDNLTCPTNAESTCSSLTVLVSVRYFVGVQSSQKSKTVQLMAPEGQALVNIVTNLLQNLQINSGGDRCDRVFSIALLIADMLNFNSAKWPATLDAFSYKTDVRFSVATYISPCIYSPLNPASVLKSSGVLQNVLQVVPEISTNTVEICLNMIQTVITKVLALDASGVALQSPELIQSYMMNAISKVFAAQSQLAALAAGRLTSSALTVTSRSSQHRESSKYLRSSLHHPIPTSKMVARQAVSQSQELQLFSTLEQLAALQALGMVVGQDPRTASTSEFWMQDRITDRQGLSGLSLVLGDQQNYMLKLPVSSAGLQGDQFHLETALIFANPIKRSQTELSCLDASLQYRWVYVVPNSVPEFRIDATRYGLSSCGILSPLISVKVLTVATGLFNDYVDPSEGFEATFPFDPQRSQEIMQDLHDSYTGTSSSASCVYFDTQKLMWTTTGIQHIETFLGNKTSATAYVKCRLTRLGIYAVSEVQQDCANQVLGVAVKDVCNVCAGGNVSCSGCDNMPYTGRDKQCSGHGVCDSNPVVAERTCVCEKPYYGTMCNNFCSDALNCSGNGRCEVKTEGTSATAQCICNPGYELQANSNPAIIATCVARVSNKTAFFGKGGIGWFLVIGIPAVVLALGVGCMCYRYTRNVKRRMLREKEENMKEIQQTRALLAFNDKPSTIEVEADLCQAVALQYAQDIPPVMRVRPVTSSKMMLTSLDPMEEHMLESESVSSFEMPASMDRIGELYPSLSQRVKSYEENGPKF
uniref:EGF-like domain-containing protein n=1 Tax=Hanusia phi TaxID=3032 RepID=A0A7S0HJ60_9CRYP